MNRRAFIFSGAVASSAVAGAAQAASAADAAQHHGKTVRLKGWLKPVCSTSSHYFVLSPEKEGRDPGSADYAAWRDSLVRVYPAHADRMRTGQVEVVGQVLAGRFQDAGTQHVATRVMIDAVMA